LLNPPYVLRATCYYVLRATCYVLRATVADLRLLENLQLSLGPAAQTE
jgi:hypothetical protein